MALHNATVRTPTSGDNESCSGFPTSQEASQELVLVGGIPVPSVLPGKRLDSKQTYKGE